MNPRNAVDKLYGEIWADDSPALEAETETSLNPRGTDWLFEAFEQLGPQPGQLVVDVGARDATHTIRLVRQHGLRALHVVRSPVVDDGGKLRLAAELDHVGVLAEGERAALLGDLHRGRAVGVLHEDVGALVEQGQ